MYKLHGNFDELTYCAYVDIYIFSYIVDRVSVMPCPLFSTFS